MKHTNLRQQQEAEQRQANQHFQGESQAHAREFATVDDLLRFDSSQNPVPPGVAERLNRSIEAEPSSAQDVRPWYRRIFG